MFIVRILGLIDFLSAIAFLMLIFGMSGYLPYFLFCGGLLFLKSLFILKGEPLSLIDGISAILLISSIFFTLPTIILLVPAFLLLAKAVVSFA